jgi:hypothetical protein
MIDVTVAQAATCAATGTMNTKCDRNCGHTGTRATAIDPAAHQWGAYEVTAPATCSGSGLETRTCTLNAAHKETQPIAKDPAAHDWSAWVQTKAPTETEGGEETRICNHNLAHMETRIIYNVKFDPDNGQPTWTKTVQDGGKIDEPDKPTKEGLGLYGWYYNDSPWNFNNTITGPMTLTAQYGHTLFYGVTPTDEDWAGEADPFDISRFDINNMTEVKAKNNQSLTYNSPEAGYIMFVYPKSLHPFIAKNSINVVITGSFEIVKEIIKDGITYNIAFFKSPISGTVAITYEFPGL